MFEVVLILKLQSKFKLLLIEKMEHLQTQPETQTMTKDEE